MTKNKKQNKKVSYGDDAEGLEMLRHQNRKEIMALKSEQIDKLQDHKINFLNKTYEYKFKFLERQEELKMKRLIAIKSFA